MIDISGTAACFKHVQTIHAWLHGCGNTHAVKNTHTRHRHTTQALAQTFESSISSINIKEHHGYFAPLSASFLSQNVFLCFTNDYQSRYN